MFRMFRILRNSAARLWRATGTSVTIDAHRHAAGLAEEIAQGADVLESASHGDPRIGKRGLLQKPLGLSRDFIIMSSVRAEVKDAIDIEVKVTNLWPNRLIGDDRFCSDDCDWSPHRREKTVVEYGIKRIPEWVKQGRRSPTGRHTFTTWKHWTKDDAPLPSGLLGPVVFRFEKAGTRQVERAAPAADFTLEKSGVRHDLGRGHDARHDTRRLAGERNRRRGIREIAPERRLPDENHHSHVALEQQALLIGTDSVAVGV